MRIQVDPLRPCFAARIFAADLASPLSADTLATLKNAIDTYAVLVVPDQTLDDDHLLALGRAFGDVEPPRNHRVVLRLKHAELADISNLDANNTLRAADDHRRLELARQPAVAFGRLIPRGAGRALDAVRPYRTAGRRRDRIRRPTRRLRCARCADKSRKSRA